uniref:Uncharacterized protein n=1 Tax=Setaria viridis TaxID=4556 RepID=A0A4U6VCY9_SETVI|nr:hypothetical protein SEVIR_4G148201v2 [Setaria viridis]
MWDPASFTAPTFPFHAHLLLSFPFPFSLSDLKAIRHGGWGGAPPARPDIVGARGSSINARGARQHACSPWRFPFPFSPLPSRPPSSPRGARQERRRAPRGGRPAGGGERRAARVHGQGRRRRCDFDCFFGNFRLPKLCSKICSKILSPTFCSNVCRQILFKYCYIFVRFCFEFLLPLYNFWSQFLFISFIHIFLFISYAHKLVM